MHVRLIIYALLIMFCVSCSNNQAQTKTGNSEQTCIDSSKFVYHNRLQPVPLSSEQIQQISNNLREDGNKIDDIWFVRVLYCKEDIYTTDVYFQPTEQSKRIVKGKYSRYDSSWTSYKKFRESIYYKKLFGDKKIELPDYIYVAPPENSNLSNIAIPTSKLTPFELPEGFTNQEIIEIVDFVRSGPDIKRDEDSNVTSYYPDKVDTELPIHSINKVDGKIEVQTGTQEGPLAGSGDYLIIQKTDDVYELISIGMWVS